MLLFSYLRHQWQLAFPTKQSLPTPQDNTPVAQPLASVSSDQYMQVHSLALARSVQQPKDTKSSMHYLAAKWYEAQLFKSLQPKGVNMFLAGLTVTDWLSLLGLLPKAVAFVEGVFGPGTGAQKLAMVTNIVTAAVPAVATSIATQPASATHLESVINSTVAALNAVVPSPAPIVPVPASAAQAGATATSATGT
jgi:hypothetical protein